MVKLFKYIIVGLLSAEAALVLRKYSPLIIAISGSVGKTTTKDAIAHVLKEKVVLRKSEKSFNSELGVPLSILGLPNAWWNPLGWIANLYKGARLIWGDSPYPEVLILEVGADHPGDIKRLMRWMKPHIAVLTRFPDLPVHVENFPSPEAVREEKTELILALGSGDTFVGNADDPYILPLAEKTPARAILFGFGPKAQMQGSNLKVRYALHNGNNAPVGMSFDVSWEEKKYPVFIDGVLGKEVCMAALAACAVGVARGASMGSMTETLISFATPPGRMRVVDGKDNSIIIDDSYNSSPIAAEAALETLRSLQGARKIAMLGDMLELGTFSEEEHWKVGRLAGSFVDELVTVGKRAQWVAEAGKSGGLPQGRIHEFTDSIAAGKWMANEVRRGDIILVKGSQGSGANTIRMERTVKLIMQFPEKAKDLLVRQEKEWEKR